MKATISRFLQERVGYLIIKLLRKRQDKFYEQIVTYQRQLEKEQEGSFRELSYTLGYHLSKTLYWFCVANAWVEGQTPRKEG